MTARVSVASLLAVCLALVAPLAILTAQAAGTVSGRITSEIGQPVVGAQVYLSGSQLGSVSRADGRFSIANVPAGTHELRAIQIGMKPDTRSVTVSAGATTEVNITMSAQTL